MIIHNVFFKIKPSVSQEVIDLAFDHLFHLKTKLSGIIKITGGKCRFHEEKWKDHFTHGFSIDFEDEKAYENFLNDPLAIPAKNSISNISYNEDVGLYSFNIGEFSSHDEGGNQKYKIQTPRLRLTPPGSIY